MIRYTATVIYRDGRRLDVTGGPREWVAWEAYALSHNLPTAGDQPGRTAGLTMTWYLAFLAAVRGEKDHPGYLPWLDTLEDVVGFKVLDADPTRPAPLAGPSSSSLSLPEPIPNGSSPPGHHAISQPSRTS